MAPLVKRRMMYEYSEEACKEITTTDTCTEDDTETFCSMTRPAQDSDSQGIKSLLKEIFPNAHVDLDSLTKLIISQCNCLVLKQLSSDDENAEEINDPIEVYMVSTVLRVKQNVDCILQLRDHLMILANEYAPDSIKAKIKDILEDNAVELEMLINERDISIAAEMAISPLEYHFVSIQQNICESILNSAYFIYISKIFKVTKKYTEELNDDILKKEKILWINLEDKVIAKKATYMFEFPVDSELVNALPNKLWIDGPDYWDPDNYATAVPYRRVLIFEFSKWQTIIKRMRNKFNYHDHD